MKPGIPKGTRDFSPEEMIRRNHVFHTIQNVYRKFGYVQIETPAMENLTTLEGKYGDEGDKLLFRILNSGEPFQKLSKPAPEVRTSEVSEKGLRYDLTVPFARYVVMHQNEITFPFKRFQIQPVWRADRPQKGRYREFYQCDADVIGSNSLLNEVELVRIIIEVFKSLGIQISVRLNNRKILAGLAELIGEPEKIIDITVAIDKLEKIGREKVVEELLNKGLSKDAVQKLQPVFDMGGDNDTILASLERMLKDSETGMKGIFEMNFILDTLKDVYPNDIVPVVDVTLARGLNYYTGSIIEVKVDDSRSEFSSSICGGGRYDDLTGIFGLPGVSGVGISFGADRICDVLEEIGAFPDFSNISTRILFVNFGQAEARHCLKIVSALRDKGIYAELYPDEAKMKKQMSYADSRKIPFVALVGTEEMKSRKITVKNMEDGSQSSLSIDDLVAKLG